MLPLQMPRMPVSAPTVKVAIPGMMISWEAGRVLAAAKVLHSPVVIVRDTEDCISDEDLQLLPTSPKMPPKS